MVEYPYLVGKRDEFCIGKDGISAHRKRFGDGEVVGYRVSFKDSEQYIALDYFLKGKIALIIPPEAE